MHDFGYLLTGLVDARLVEENGLPASMVGFGPEAGRHRLRACVESVILVVEDDEDVRMFVVELLQEYGYRILEAADAAAALALLESDTQIDLMFTDIVMPGPMNGADLAHAALKLRPNLKVLYTSGYVGHPIPRLLPVRLSPNFIEKPYRPAKLIERLEALLHR